MHNRLLSGASLGALALTLAACNERATVTSGADFGPLPTLVAPASGMAVNALATGLDHPHALCLLPNGDVLVAGAIAPDQAPGAHTDSLGLTFNTGNLFAAAMQGGAFVGNTVRRVTPSSAQAAAAQ